VLMADTSDEGIVGSTGKNLTRTPTRLVYDAGDLLESRQKQLFPSAMSKFHTSTSQLAWIEKRLYCESEFIFQRDVDTYTGLHLSTSQHNWQPMLSGR
jgi:hypothetical protein